MDPHANNNTAEILMKYMQRPNPKGPNMFPQPSKRTQAEHVADIQRRMDTSAENAKRIQEKQKATIALNAASGLRTEVLQKYLQDNLGITPETQLFTEVETLSMLNKERTALNTRYDTLRDSIVKQMKALKTKKVKTPANVTATLFTQLRTTLDMVIIAQLLTPKQIKKASKRSKVTTLKVTP